MYFNIKCIGKLQGPTNEFERSLVFETGEFERPKFDCMYYMPVLNQEILINPEHSNACTYGPILSPCKSQFWTSFAAFFQLMSYLKEELIFQVIVASSCFIRMSSASNGF